MKIYDPEQLGLKIYKRSGDELLVYCPYHDDKNASAEYNIIKGLFFCFGCKESRTAKQLANDLSGYLVEISDAKYRIENNDGDDIDWISLMSNDLALDNPYLRDRLVAGHQVLYYDIRENKDGVIFPIKDKFNNLTGVQIRHYEKMPKYKIYGKRTPVWPIKNTFDPGIVLITEGVFGTLRVKPTCCNSVSLMGSSNVEKVVKFFRTNGMLEPYALMDMDFAGLLAAGKFVLMGIPAIILPLSMPESPDELKAPHLINLRRNLDEFSTLDVNKVIGRSDESFKLQSALMKFWRKL